MLQKYIAIDDSTYYIFLKTECVKNSLYYILRNKYNFTKLYHTSMIVEANEYSWLIDSCTKEDPWYKSSMEDKKCFNILDILKKQNISLSIENDLKSYNKLAYTKSPYKLQSNITFKGNISINNNKNIQNGLFEIKDSKNQITISYLTIENVTFNAPLITISESTVIIKNLKIYNCTFDKSGDSSGKLLDIINSNVILDTIDISGGDCLNDSLISYNSKVVNSNPYFGSDISENDFIPKLTIKDMSINNVSFGEKGIVFVSGNEIDISKLNIYNCRGSTSPTDSYISNKITSFNSPLTFLDTTVNISDSIFKNNNYKIDIVNQKTYSAQAITLYNSSMNITDTEFYIADDVKKYYTDIIDKTYDEIVNNKYDYWNEYDKLGSIPMIRNFGEKLSNSNKINISNCTWYNDLSNINYLYFFVDKQENNDDNKFTSELSIINSFREPPFKKDQKSFQNIPNINIYSNRKLKNDGIKDDVKNDGAILQKYTNLMGKNETDKLSFNSTGATNVLTLNYKGYKNTGIELYFKNDNTFLPALTGIMCINSIIEPDLLDSFSKNTCDSEEQFKIYNYPNKESCIERCGGTSCLNIKNEADFHTCLFGCNNEKKDICELHLNMENNILLKDKDYSFESLNVNIRPTSKDDAKSFLEVSGVGFSFASLDISDINLHMHHSKSNPSIVTKNSNGIKIQGGSHIFENNSNKVMVADRDINIIDTSIVFSNNNSVSEGGLIQACNSDNTCNITLTDSSMTFIDNSYEGILYIDNGNVIINSGEYKILKNYGAIIKTNDKNSTSINLIDSSMIFSNNTSSSSGILEQKKGNLSFGGGKYTFEKFEQANKSVLYGDKIYVIENNSTTTELSFLNISGTAIEANVFDTSLACKKVDASIKGCNNKYIFKENRFNESKGIININNNLYMAGGRWDFSNNKVINNSNIFNTTAIITTLPDSKIYIKNTDISFDTILYALGTLGLTGPNSYDRYKLDSRTEYYSSKDAKNIWERQYFNSDKGTCEANCLYSQGICPNSAACGELKSEKICLDTMVGGGEGWDKMSQYKSSDKCMIMEHSDTPKYCQDQFNPVTTSSSLPHLRACTWQPS